MSKLSLILSALIATAAAFGEEIAEPERMRMERELVTAIRSSADNDEGIFGFHARRQRLLTMDPRDYTGVFKDLFSEDYRFRVRSTAIVVAHARRVFPEEMKKLMDETLGEWVANRESRDVLGGADSAEKLPKLWRQHLEQDNCIRSMLVLMADTRDSRFVHHVHAMFPSGNKELDLALVHLAENVGSPDDLEKIRAKKPEGNDQLEDAFARASARMRRPKPTGPVDEGEIERIIRAASAIKEFDFDSSSPADLRYPILDDPRDLSPALARLLGMEFPLEVRFAALHALLARQRMDKSLRQPLEKALVDWIDLKGRESFEVERASIEELLFGEAAYVARLIQLLTLVGDSSTAGMLLGKLPINSSDLNVRALQSIGELGSADLLPKLLTLRIGEPEFRSALVYCIARIRERGGLAFDLPPAEDSK